MWTLMKVSCGAQDRYTHLDKSTENFVKIRRTVQKLCREIYQVFHNMGADQLALTAQCRTPAVRMWFLLNFIMYWFFVSVFRVAYSNWTPSTEGLASVQHDKRQRPLQAAVTSQPSQRPGTTATQRPGQHEAQHGRSPSEGPTSKCQRCLRYSRLHIKL